MRISDKLYVQICAILSGYIRRLYGVIWRVSARTIAPKPIHRITNDHDHGGTVHLCGSGNSTTKNTPQNIEHFRRFLGRCREISTRTNDHGQTLPRGHADTKRDCRANIRLVRTTTGTLEKYNKIQADDHEQGRIYVRP